MSELPRRPRAGVLISPNVTAPGRSCTRCGARVELRVNRRIKTLFYGCSTYPQCRATSSYNNAPTAQNKAITPTKGPSEETMQFEAVLALLYGGKSACDPSFDHLKELTRLKKGPFVQAGDEYGNSKALERDNDQLA